MQPACTRTMSSMGVGVAVTGTLCMQGVAECETVSEEERILSGVDSTIRYVMAVAHIHTHASIHTHTQTHTHANTHTHIHTHTHTLKDLCTLSPTHSLKQAEEFRLWQEYDDMEESFCDPDGK